MSLEVAKGLGIKHNVCIRVIDEVTNKVVKEHVGHNAATNTLINGIGQYLLGGAVTGSGELLRSWIPQYISLGTMGLSNQEEDEEGLPLGIGDNGSPHIEQRYKDYMEKTPGFGSDGYDPSLMNGRQYAGLGPMFANRAQPETVGCELISNTFPRTKISFRQCLPESRSEYPKTIDVVFSAMITTGSLAQFREPGKNYLFISEVGLWSTPTWTGSGSNGMLAGYRIAPPDEENWNMDDPANRKILQENIIKVGTNQVAQIIWKIQLGSIEQFGNYQF